MTTVATPSPTLPRVPRGAFGVLGALLLALALAPAVVGLHVASVNVRPLPSRTRPAPKLSHELLLASVGVAFGAFAADGLSGFPWSTDE